MIGREELVADKLLKLCCRRCSRKIGIIYVPRSDDNDNVFLASELIKHLRHWQLAAPRILSSCVADGKVEDATSPGREKMLDGFANLRFGALFIAKNCAAIGSRTQDLRADDTDLRNPLVGLKTAVDITKDGDAGNVGPVAYAISGIRLARTKVFLVDDGSAEQWVPGYNSRINYADEWRVCGQGLQRFRHGDGIENRKLHERDCRGEVNASGSVV
jgi:hypothetical protein